MGHPEVLPTLVEHGADSLKSARPRRTSVARSQDFHTRYTADRSQRYRRSSDLDREFLEIQAGIRVVTHQIWRNVPPLGDAVPHGTRWQLHAACPTTGVPEHLLQETRQPRQGAFQFDAPSRPPVPRDVAAKPA